MLRCPAGTRGLFLLHNVKAGAHMASCTVSTGGNCPMTKAVRVCNWPLIPSSAYVKNEWKYTFAPPPPPPIRLNAMLRDNFALPSANNNMDVDFIRLTSVNLINIRSIILVCVWCALQRAEPGRTLLAASMPIRINFCPARMYWWRILFGDGMLSEAVVEICHVERIPSSIVTRILLKPAKPPTPNFISWNEKGTSNSEWRHWRLSASLRQICNFVIGYA